LYIFSLPQIKDKYVNLKKDTKKKLSANHREVIKTGGGEAILIPLTDIDRLMETQLGKASICGVGGIDTMRGKLK
jgi:hypothetical protein